MTLRRLFVGREALRGEVAQIVGQDYHHLTRVVRVRVGENLILLDGEGSAFEAVIESIEKREMRARIVGPAEAAPEPPVRVSIAQAIGKGDRMEQVIQHGTEIGAAEFIPLITERTVVRLDARGAAEKRARWQLIAKGAAEQSGRARIPVVHAMSALPDLLAMRESRLLLLHLHGRPLFQALERGPAAWTIAVGPEGGFSESEAALAEAAGAEIVSLGPHILRTETAALVALSQILYESGRPR